MMRSSDSWQTIPLRWIPKEGMQGFPFDGEDFLKRVEQAAV
jgi:hypothetical protein